MNSLTTVFLLLAGLIASCTAMKIDVENDRLQDSSSPSSEESDPVLETREEDLTGYPILETEAELLRKLETACYEKTGSNQTFEALTDSVDEVKNCLLMNIDVANIDNDSRRLNASTRHDFFPKYCPQLRYVLPCFQPKFRLYRKCFDDDIFEVRRFKAFSELLDLFCENDGEILFRNGTNFDVCTQGFNFEWDRCEHTITSSTKLVAVSKYGEAQCEVLTKSRDCMERVFKRCNGPKLIDLLDVYWRAVLKNSRCGNDAS